MKLSTKKKILNGKTPCKRIGHNLLKTSVYDKTIKETVFP